MSTTYRVKRGINYPDAERPGQEKRAEAGTVLDGSELPSSSIPWLIEAEALEECGPAEKPVGPKLDGKKKE